MTPTKAKTAHFEDFTELEQSAICLTAMVARQGGKILISNKEMNADIGKVVVDILRFENGDVKIEFMKR